MFPLSVASPMQVLPLRPIDAASASLPVPELLTDSHGHVTIGSPNTRRGSEFLRRLESSVLSFVLQTSGTRRRWPSPADSSLCQRRSDSSSTVISLLVLYCVLATKSDFGQSPLLSLQSRRLPSWRLDVSVRSKLYQSSSARTNSS